MNEIMDDYDAGVLAGYAKSITLIRHLQRTLPPTHPPTRKTPTAREILTEAMELIAEKIEPNE